MRPSSAPGPSSYGTSFVWVWREGQLWLGLLTQGDHPVEGVMFLDLPPLLPGQAWLGSETAVLETVNEGARGSWRS